MKVREIFEKSFGFILILAIIGFIFLYSDTEISDCGGTWQCFECFGSRTCILCGGTDTVIDLNDLQHPEDCSCYNGICSACNGKCQCEYCR